ncbi:hypothetical protein BU17DRAFT_40923 [Hysterangium stoloniferum]|nr:hypothetical protein BU17DRAFT_40923 [Hysterangium stoloniferum]
MHYTGRLASCRLLILIYFLLFSFPVIASPVIIISPTGNISVVDSDTLHPIPQFSATDGGAGMVNSIIWITFSIVVALPMAVAGVRAGRITIGAAFGFAMAISVWAAFVNGLPMQLSSTPSSSDLILTLVILATFVFFTFIGAFLRFLYPFGLALLGACAGTSLMTRVVIIRPGLLIPLKLYILDVVLVVLGAVLGGLTMFWRRRWCVIISTSLLATFFLALSVDLIIHSKSTPQQGMARGLRLLLDRNPSHIAEILGTAYTPTLATQVTLGTSIALTPLFVYLQHRLFPSPFHYALHPIKINSVIGGDPDDPDAGIDFRPDRPFLTSSVFQTLPTLRTNNTAPSKIQASRRNLGTEIEMMGTLKDRRYDGGVGGISSGGGGGVDLAWNSGGGSFLGSGRNGSPSSRFSS